MVCILTDCSVHKVYHIDSFKSYYFVACYKINSKFFTGAIKRDTAVVAGGKQVIRLVTTKQKSNPYNLVGRNKNAATSSGQSVELTMGQRLAMKHFIPVQQPQNNQSGSVNCTKSGESGPESDWTWETCSSSDEEAVTFVKNAGTQTCTNTIQTNHATQFVMMALIQIEACLFNPTFYRRSHSKGPKERALHVHQTKTKHFIAKLVAQPIDS